VHFDRAPGRGEVLSRFIFSRRQFSPEQNRVKPTAFLPSKESRETSVFRTGGLEPAEIRRIGDQLGRDQALKAWGDVLAGAVFDIGLEVRPDNDPERHAAIVGWPEEKDQQLSLAQRLAADAVLRVAA
jgi:hypothetical protein